VVFGCLLFAAGPASAAPVTGTLTIDTQSPDIWFSVNVKGAAVPMATKLADAAGEHVADVTVTVANCPADVHAEQRELGLTGSTWCVHVSHLQAGYAVSGTIANADTSLSLTVKRKDGPVYPVTWSILALVLAAGISVLGNTYVPALTSRLLLRQFGRDRSIPGLGDWVRTAAADGVLSDDDIVSRARWAKKYGTKRVMAARGQLAKALADPDLSVPADSPLRQACQAESLRPATDVKRDDLLTDEGARSIKAADLLTSLTAANTALHDFTASANEIIATLAGPDQERAIAMRDGALRMVHDMSATNVPHVATVLSQTVQSMRSLQTVPLEPSAAGSLVAAALSGSAVHRTATEIAASIKEAVEPVAVYIPAALLAFVVMAGAVATVFSTQYLANPNFGTAADYWALAVSAYGSAQVTAIAAALLLIRPPKPWYG
jgi:hypothetical protein